MKTLHSAERHLADMIANANSDLDDWKKDLTISPQAAMECAWRAYEAAAQHAVATEAAALIEHGVASGSDEREVITTVRDELQRVGDRLARRAASNPTEEQRRISTFKLLETADRWVSKLEG